MKEGNIPVDRLGELRKEIDSIDGCMILLLESRMRIVEAVGRLKKETGTPPLQPGRWQEVLDDRMGLAVDVGVSPELVHDIWELIHANALSIEEKI